MRDKTNIRGAGRIAIIVLLFCVIPLGTAVAGSENIPQAREMSKSDVTKPAVPADTVTADSVSTSILAGTDNDIEETVEHSSLPAALRGDKAEGAESSNEPILPGMTVSGFVDVIGSYSNSQQDHTNISILEAEIDFSATPSQKVELATSVTLEPETRSMELTWATAAFNLVETPQGMITRATLTTGLFNPAFGIDCRRNNAECRKLASAPLVVQLTHQGWGDVGVQFDLEGPFANISAYVVNGFEPSEEVMQDVIDLTTGLGDTVDVSPSNAFGTRLGLKPITNLELGGSFAVGFNKSDQDEMVMTGADLDFSWNALRIESEYIVHSVNRSILKQDNRGFYVQPTCTFGRTFATVRYDSFKAEGHDRAERFTIGGGYQIADGVEFRLETALADHGHNNETTTQVFVGF